MAALSPFDRPDTVQLNGARLHHLESFGLPLEGRSVLEVGAGVGKLTYFFEDLGCAVLAIDGRPENVARNLREHPWRNVEVLDVTCQDPGGQFEIVFCYGLLYHVHNPRGV